ncbi:MAG: serine/threonine-protein kinase [Deltaproteobacteria bacterium]
MPTLPLKGDGRNPVVPLKTGTLVGERYRVIEQIGAGAFGAVYRADNIHLGNAAAIKILHGERTGDAWAMSRFFQEAQATAKLHHPNVVQVTEVGVDPGLEVPFIAMEYIEGRTLRALLDEVGTLPESAAIALLSQVVRALVEAHAKGIVHRDIKPSNIMVSRLTDGEELVRVLDFGIAKVLDAENRLGPHTTQGEALGTASYMSPEQCRGASVDARSDLYSLGCVFHEILCGAPPFSGGTSAVVRQKHLVEPPPSLAEGAFASSTVALHGDLLSKDPAARPPSAAAVLAVLTGLDQADSVSPPETTLRTRTPDGASKATGKEQPRERQRALFAVSLVGLGAIVSLVVAAMLARPSPAVNEPLPSGPSTPVTARDVETPAPLEVVTIEVTSKPAGATVLVDGLERGRTPIRFEHTKSSVSLELEIAKPAYGSQRHIIVPDRPMSLSYALERRAPRRRVNVKVRTTR